MKKFLALLFWPLLALAQPISQLPAAGPLTGTELVPMAQSGKTVRAMTGQVFVTPTTAAEIAAGITPVAKVYPPGNVLRYGADPTCAFDSTAAFVSAGKSGNIIQVPAGCFFVTSGPSLITSGGMVGQGPELTSIIVTDTGSLDVFKFTGTFAGKFADFSLSVLTTKTAGYGLVIQTGGTETQELSIDNIHMIGLPSCINFVNASHWTLKGSHFYNYSADCLHVDNTHASDGGDSTVIGNGFEDDTNTTGVAIRQVASGGLKVEANKMNLGSIGYLLDLTTAGNVSDLLFVGNSCEGMTDTCVKFQRTSGTRVFAQGVIVGNEFLVSKANSHGIFSGGGSSFLNRVNIGSNVFFISDTGTSDAVNMDWVNDLLIGENVIIGPASGSTTGVLIGVNNTNVKLGPQQMRGLNTQISAGSNTVIASFVNIPTTVGALGTCAAGNKGSILSVSDANAPTYGSTLAGGGAVYTLALCNGANWVAH